MGVGIINLVAKNPLLGVDGCQRADNVDTRLFLGVVLLMPNDMRVGSLIISSFLFFWMSMGVGHLIDKPKKTGCKSTVLLIEMLKKWEL